MTNQDESNPAPSTRDASLRWWLWPQVIGLDAPLVAAGWLAAFAHSHRVHLTSAFYLALMAATWLIYLLDRTSDAHSQSLEAATSARHEFCRRHSQWLMKGLGPLLMLGGGYLALWQLPALMGKHAIGIGLLTLWYLAFHSGRDRRGLQKSFVLAAVGGSLWLVLELSLPLWLKGIFVLLLFFAASLATDDSRASATPQAPAKELLAGLLFALGCIASVHVWPIDGHSMLCPETLLLWALATLNLLIIHRSEREAHAEGSPTEVLAPWWLRPPIQRGLIVSLALVSIYLATTHTNAGTRAIASVASASALLMLALLSRVRVMEPQSFHLLADLALVVPLPLVWFSHAP